MKEIIIRIYSGNDESVINAVKNNTAINFFDLLIDGEVYSNMDRLKIEVHAPEQGENGSLNLDQTRVSMVIDKHFV